ncbi:MAG: hypothetical protein ACLFTB_00960 [Desulfovibrionales bacterium]
MLWLHIIFALVIAVILGLIFATGFKRTGPWPGVIGFVLLIFLAAWAGGIWITPFGPSLWGVFIVPFFIAGLIFALLLAAATPFQSEDSTVHFETREEHREREEERSMWGIFFWALIIAMAVVILVRYLIPVEPVY